MELPEQIRSNLTKGDSSMCMAVAHHPFFHVPFTLLPVKLSSSLFLTNIYIHSPHSFSLSRLASFWQLAEVCFHTYCFGYYTYCISLGISALYLGEF